MECAKNHKIKNLIDNIINENTTREEEIQYYDTILDDIENNFTSENFDSIYLDNGVDEIIKTEKIKITLTTIDNQKNNLDDEMTRLYLDECELLLRKNYNLTNNDSLYLKIVEANQEGMIIPKVEYEIYCRLSGTNLVKLDKSICKDTKISLFIYIIINGNSDKLNCKSDYYNDICYATTSDSGTDISLKDRQNECIYNTACDDDCDFLRYN